MGYYTNVHMEIKDSTGKEVNESHVAFKLIAYRFYEIWESYRDITSDEFRCDQEAYAEECLSDFLDWKEVKWYELDSDMMKLSKLCPDFIFIIEGQGEDREDWWIKWWENGVQNASYAELTPPSGPSGYKFTY